MKYGIAPYLVTYRDPVYFQTLIKLEDLRIGDVQSFKQYLPFRGFLNIFLKSVGPDTLQQAIQ